MIGKRLARRAAMALLAVLVPCAGCCSFWERQCGFHQQQPVYYGAPAGCCCPTQTGFQPVAVAQPGWTPTSGACTPCR